jgi:hypothetical protein
LQQAEDLRAYQMTLTEVREAFMAQRYDKRSASFVSALTHHGQRTIIRTEATELRERRLKPFYKSKWKQNCVKLNQRNNVSLRILKHAFSSNYST